MSARILVVDDDPTIVRLLQLNLELEGYEVLSASNGRDALTAVDAHKPDLLVCDVMMPVLDGHEVVSRLRRDVAHKELPILMLSAKAQEMDIQSGIGAGADAYLTKPFEPDDLLLMVKNLLSKPRRKTASKPRGGRSKGAGR